MKNQFISILIFILLFRTIIPFSVSSNETINKTIYVDDDNILGPWDGSIEHPYRYIQDGIDAAVDRDTIFVYSGFYHENLVVNTSIILQGENKNATVIDGGKYTNIVRLCTNYTNFIGFTIHSSGTENIGIQLEGINNCHISNNIISNAFIGIRLSPISNNNTVSDNIILNSTSFGIHLLNSSGNILSYNTISGCVGGSAIYIEYFSTFNFISNNILLSNDQAGVHLSSRNNIISDNFISSNEYIGIGLYNASPSYDDAAEYSIIKGNTIMDCYTAIVSWHIKNLSITGNVLLNNRFGIEQFYCTGGIISENTILNNSWDGIFINSSEKTSIIRNIVSNCNIRGIHFQDSSGNILTSNDIKGNHYGIRFIRSSDNNIKFNNIINNEWGVELIDSSNNNICCNNFKKNWEKHAFFLDCDDIVWKANYWNRPRILPYSIFGRRTVERPLLGEIKAPLINFDLQPALKQYDIL